MNFQQSFPTTTRDSQIGFGSFGAMGGQARGYQPVGMVPSVYGQNQSFQQSAAGQPYPSGGLMGQSMSGGAMGQSSIGMGTGQGMSGGAMGQSSIGMGTGQGSFGGQSVIGSGPTQPYHMAHYQGNLPGHDQDLRGDSSRPAQLGGSAYLGRTGFESGVNPDNRQGVQGAFGSAMGQSAFSGGMGRNMMGGTGMNTMDGTMGRSMMGSTGMTAMDGTMGRSMMGGTGMSAMDGTMGRSMMGGTMGGTGMSSMGGSTAMDGSMGRSMMGGGTMGGTGMSSFAGQPMDGTMGRSMMGGTMGGTGMTAMDGTMGRSMMGGTMGGTGMSSFAGQPMDGTMGRSMMGGTMGGAGMSAMDGTMGRSMMGGTMGGTGMTAMDGTMGSMMGGTMGGMTAMDGTMGGGMRQTPFTGPGAFSGANISSGSLGNAGMSPYLMNQYQQSGPTTQQYHMAHYEGNVPGHDQDLRGDSARPAQLGGTAYAGRTGFVAGVNPDNRYRFGGSVNGGLY